MSPAPSASCLYEGWVRHRRHGPVAHAFRYPVFLAYLDLDELPALFDPYLLRSARRAAPGWLRRADQFGDPGAPLDRTVRDLVEARTGRRPAGPIRLLSHLRYLGHVFNPVAFFYCFAPGGERLETVVAEVSNTPWGERHLYVLDADHASRAGRSLRWDEPKAFHVSPFMPFEVEYRWRTTVPAERLAVRIDVHDRDRALLEAALVLRRRPIDRKNLAAVVVRHPAATLAVLPRIYRNALHLWLAGAPFHPHPGRHGESPAAR